MIGKITGRDKECQALENCLKAKTSQLIVVYGRLGVGKTFLVNEFFSNRFAFRVTGLANQPRRAQLEAFTASLNNYSSCAIATLCSI